MKSEKRKTKKISIAINPWVSKDKKNFLYWLDAQLSLQRSQNKN